MSIHDGFLELAAASIDFELDDYDRAELDRHLAGCEECRQSAAALREDAAAIAYMGAPRLSPARADAILATALRPRSNGPPVGVLAVAALIAVVGVGLLAAGLELSRRPEGSLAAVVPSASGSANPDASQGESAPPSGSAGQSPERGASTPPAGSPASAVLPVRGDVPLASILMGTDPLSGLYVAIPARGGTVLARVNSRARPVDGWPIFIPRAGPCGLLLPVADGSVRLVCFADDLVAEMGDPNVRAFAFDASGNRLSGWPVEISCCFTGRMVGDQLTLFIRQFAVDLVEEGQEGGGGWLVAVAADGTVRQGDEVAFTDCCENNWAVGPDGIAYGTTHDFSDPAVTSQLLAMGLSGAPDGFPVAIDGNASRPTFDGAGRIHVAVASSGSLPTRTLVFETDGLPVAAGSPDLALTATSEWWGAGDYFPAPPLVGRDGTSFVIGTPLGRTEGTTAVGLNPSGQVMAGWPYRSDLPFQDTGTCGEGETGCGGFRAAPAIGPDNRLYLIHAARNASAGGSVVAVGNGGVVVDGWPVGLTRGGSAFWSVVVANDGSVYVLAIEPESNGGSSATILSIAPDSTVDSKLTVVEP